MVLNAFFDCGRQGVDPGGGQPKLDFEIGVLALICRIARGHSPTRSTCGRVPALPVGLLSPKIDLGQRKT